MIYKTIRTQIPRSSKGFILSISCTLGLLLRQMSEMSTKTTKSLIDHFSTTKPGNILIADILRIGTVDHYMIFDIRKLNARKFRKKKEESLKPATLANVTKNLSETT